MTKKLQTPLVQFLGLFLCGALLAVPYCGMAPIVAWVATAFCLCNFSDRMG